MADGRGGKREGAGRKLGATTTKTRAIADRALRDGISPLEVMLDNMRKAAVEARRAEKDAARSGKPEEVVQLTKSATDYRMTAQACAKDAAPYVHPRLANVEHAGKDGGPIVVELVRFSPDADKAAV